MDIKDILKKKPVNNLDKLKGLQDAIKGVEEEIKHEYNNEQEDVFISYTRPYRSIRKKSNSTRELDSMLKLLFKGELPAEIASKVESNMIEEVVPKTNLLRLSSTNAIKVLSLVLNLYKEEEKELKEIIKKEL